MNEQDIMIEVNHMSHIYTDENGNDVRALDDVNLSIKRGEFVCIIGTNGSGKSTLAKHFNVLLQPSEGHINVCGFDTRDEAHLDEPTAMLDPKGRREVLETVHKLNKEEGITIVYITHFMEEAVTADRVVVMKNGVKLHDGTPREIFSHVDTLKGLGLDVPVASEIAFKLNAKGYEVGKSIINNEELAKGLKGSKLGKQLSAIHSTDAPRGEGTH